MLYNVVWVEKLEWRGFINSINKTIKELLVEILIVLFFVYGGDILKDIKTKEIKKKDIKVFDRATAWKERIKDPVV